ncbi:IMPACT family protein [Roseateles sp. BYS180W]|uniref:IMPACT family protein n=1 Tax=Roseateles rivi TaxID=3299028 RepID=A0ABW7FTK4_9BURK
MSFSLPHAFSHELVIKKSRFIACVEPCAGREAAQARVAQLKAEHPGAAHVCWALLAGGQSAAHDDGEPGGTAGRPMLEVLRHQDLEGVLATVVRYFGGVKLGAGGLVRAYTDAVAQALIDAPKIERVRTEQLCCTLPYAHEGVLRRCLEQTPGAQLLDVQHGALVQLRFSVPQPLVAALRQRLEDATQGRIGWLRPDAD